MSELTGNLDQFVNDMWVLEEFKARMQILITQREGMIADNLYRSSNGETPSYNDRDLFSAADAMEKLTNKMFGEKKDG